MLYDLSKLPLATQQTIEKDYFKMFKDDIKKEMKDQGIK